MNQADNNDPSPSTDPHAELPGEEWVVVRRFDNLVELDQARVALDARNIASEVKDDHTLQADPVIAVAIGGASLMVHQKDAALAGEVMHEIYGDPDIEAVEDIDHSLKKRMVVATVGSMLLGLIVGLIAQDVGLMITVGLVSALISVVIALLTAR